MAKKFHLHFRGRDYSPKLILSLASRFACGRELRPSEFSGGRETNNLLKNLGFEVTGPEVHPPPGEASRHDGRCSDCKNALIEFLRRTYGNVKVDHKILVPARLDGYRSKSGYDALKRIHAALEQHRGHRDFVRLSNLPRCDAFVPDANMVVEFDESQHFTAARHVALFHYPVNLPLGFDRQEWMSCCDETRASDRDPVFRDEQRAWYDTLRDFLPLTAGLNPTLRIKMGDIAWCSLNPGSAHDRLRFSELLQRRRQPHRIGSLAGRTGRSCETSSVRPPQLSATKLGLVSRDYTKAFPNGYRDFSHSMQNVLNLLDQQGCDTVLFSLYGLVQRENYDLQATLQPLKNIKAVLLEEYREEGTARNAVRYVVHHYAKGTWNEYPLRQWFAKLAGVSAGVLQRFVREELPRRMTGNCCVLLCGEINGTGKYDRTSRTVVDSFGLRASIPNGVRIVLNPVHDRMTRYEMPLKRRFLSQGGRWVVSVWNKGKDFGDGLRRDGVSPAWDVFHNGKRVVVSGLPNQFGLEIGVLDTRVGQSP